MMVSHSFSIAAMPEAAVRRALVFAWLSVLVVLVELVVVVILLKVVDVVVLSVGVTVDVTADAIVDITEAGCQSC